MEFADRQVVVTGGAGALGRAVTGALMEAGAVCHVACFDAAEAAGFAYRDHPRAVVRVAGDLAEAAAAERFYAEVPRLWASIHLAGGFAFGALAETAPAEVRRQVDINLVSCLMCCRAAVRAMTAGGQGGRIVNVAARPALEWRAGARMVPYAAAKAGVAALTGALAEEVAAQGILVNAIAPSIIDTPANRAAMPKADRSAWPTPEEIARTVLFLASPDNRVTRGAVVPVYGRS
jgi:NAD(P)-dependent dehydrogenase (short-subunit alcohol dehydrogenase family)